jgi:hypothetical protein
MPTRGYRKGVSDDKEPVPRSVRTHITEQEFDQLTAAADSRSITLSKLLRSLITAFTRGERLALPQGRGPTSAALRDLCRIGNNLNQLAHQAHMMRLHLLEVETRATLAAVLKAVDRLR